MAINMLAGLIAKCEFKTYIKGKETKADEYYLWNVEPNVNQNSSQFLQQLVSKLLHDNEALAVEVNGQLLVADSFTATGYALFPATFSDVMITTFGSSFTFDKTFSMSDVLYFRLNNRNIRALLANVMDGYNQLLSMAMGKYKRAGGRKGIAKLNKSATGDEKAKEQTKDLFTKGFRKYFESENAVVALPNGIEYQEITGEGSKKSTSEVNDIANITKEAFARVAQAFRIPPALLQGDIADISKLMDELLTVCIDPLADLIQTEINRKRYGKAAYLTGTYLKIDTTCIKHIDIFSIADAADKLIADSLYSVDELRQKIGDTPLNTWWSKQHVRTANYNALADSPPDDSNQTGGDTG
ncbi:MAG TPA: phage portal protein [Ruminococcaceae bacterium]|nr:phage portal protein [Oscillospiraceae bacterium]